MADVCVPAALPAVLAVFKFPPFVHVEPSYSSVAVLVVVIKPPTAKPAVEETVNEVAVDDVMAALSVGAKSAL